jgi:hypothetical protein
MNIRVLLAFAAIVSVVALCAAPASATPVTLVNPLFQDPTPTTTWTGDPAPWDSVPDGQSTTYPTGWQPVNGTNAGDNLLEYNPTSADFTSAAGDNGKLPSPLGVVKQTYGAGSALLTQTNTLYGVGQAPTLGSQALYNTSTFDNDCAILSDTAWTTITLQANKTYTLTVAIGQALDSVSGYPYYGGFGLVVADSGPGYSGSMITTEVHNSGQDVPDAGTFYDYAASFNSNDYITGKKGAPKAGDKLRIGLNLGTNAYVTDIRLDVSTPAPTPEPSTLVLLASGLVGLLAYAWRKRK